MLKNSVLFMNGNQQECLPIANSSPIKKKGLREQLPFFKLNVLHTVCYQSFQLHRSPQNTESKHLTPICESTCDFGKRMCRVFCFFANTFYKSKVISHN